MNINDKAKQVASQVSELIEVAKIVGEQPKPKDELTRLICKGYIDSGIVDELDFDILYRKALAA